MTAIRLPFHFDAAALLREVQAFPPDAFEEIRSAYISDGGLWGMHLLVGDVEHTREGGGARQKESHWLEKAPVIRETLQTFKAPLLLARIHKLQPGGSIQAHRDGNAWRMRIHVPIQTAEGSSFLLAGQELKLQAGEAWYLDVRQIHEVANRGNTERIHLVLDLERNAWWDAVMESSGLAPKAKGPYAGLSKPQLLEMKSNLEKMDNEASLRLLKALETELAKLKKRD